MRQCYVYILTNQNRTTLCVDVTSDLQRRVGQHKAGSHPGFTKKYNLHLLVHFETYPDIKAAIAREKQLKSGSRQKKEDLINVDNLDWRDLSGEFV